MTRKTGMRNEASVNTSTGLRALARRLAAVIAAAGLFGTAAAAHGVCNQTTASMSDMNLWSTHGCWQDFFVWQSRAYNTSWLNWLPRGFKDACNQNKEYPKHWSASYLVSYGLLDSNTRSFHGTVDYRRTAEAASSVYHFGFKHLASDDKDLFGRYSPSFFGTDTIETMCSLYDPGMAPNANPGSRAGDFMHEAWHAWMNKYDYDNGSHAGHHKGPLLNCTSGSCDYFYFHGIGAFGFGELWQTDGTKNRFHSPNQIQVEFLCDVHDLPQPWMPASVLRDAADDANDRATHRFINGPGYHCGDPRPW